MTDVVQLLIWGIFGVFITWGIFFAFVGFRSQSKKSRVARASAVISFIVGLVWIIMWVSAVTINILQVLGLIEGS